MYVTPEIARAAYDYLRATPPFTKRTWRLPPGEEVRFIIMENASLCGKQEYDLIKDEHTIWISCSLTAGSFTLIGDMAHEMCHMHPAQIEERLKNKKNEHGPVFKKLAKEVCKQHVFDFNRF